MKCLQVPPGKPSLYLLPDAGGGVGWGGFCFNPEIRAGAYAGHVTCLGPACSVSTSTSQRLLNGPLLCVWEADPAALGRVIRHLDGQQSAISGTFLLHVKSGAWNDLV